MRYRKNRKAQQQTFNLNGTFTLRQLMELCKTAQSGGKAKDEKLGPQIFERYAAKHDFAPNTLRRYRGVYGRFAEWCRRRGVRTVAGVDEDLADEYAKEGRAARLSAVAETSELRRIWKQALPGRLNPFAYEIDYRVTAAKERRSHRALSRVELRRIARAAADAAAERPDDAITRELADALKFGLYYGMRMCSFANLRTDEIRGTGRRRLIRHVPCKTRLVCPTPLELPVVPYVAETVERAKAEKREWLFPALHEAYAGPRYKIDLAIAQLLKRGRVRQKVDGAITSAHSLRTTFVTAMDLARAPYAVTNSVTGHSAPGKSARWRYSRPTAADRKKWIMKTFKDDWLAPQ